MMIIGINNGHDPSCALLNDGKIEVYIEEERLNRFKHGININERNKNRNTPLTPFPFLSLSYCLDYMKCSIDDVDFIVIANNEKWIVNKIPIKNKNKIIFLPGGYHHFLHALAAFISSSFSESAVLVVDFSGSIFKINDNFIKDEYLFNHIPLAYKMIQSDFFTLNNVIMSGITKKYMYEAESGYYFSTRNIDSYKLIFKNLYPLSNIRFNGLGVMYAMASIIAGFYSESSGLDESGKFMGLAPYGENVPNYIEFFNIKKHKMQFKGFESFINKKIKDDNITIKKSSKSLSKREYNLAFFTQKEFERGILSLTDYLFNMTQSENLCISGGCALNSVTNYKIIKQGKFKNVFILPNCNDAGLSIGAAYWFHLKCNYNIPIKSLKNFYLGKPYGNKDIEHLLVGLKYEKLSDDELILKTAEELSNNKIIAWFQNGSEAGPRALGNRSILANPSVNWMKDYLNIFVKFRENFRPYAASIIEEYCSDWFDVNYSPFMLIIGYVKNEKKMKIPAVVHIDGSTRLQTVNKLDNEKYYKLLQNFNKKTGIPLLLNTSLNIKGMPIVETPYDALSTFLVTEIDYLIINNYFIMRFDEEMIESYAIPNYIDKLNESFSNSRNIDFLIGFSNSLNMSVDMLKKSIISILSRLNGINIKTAVNDIHGFNKYDIKTIKRLFLFLFRERLIYSPNILNEKY